MPSYKVYYFPTRGLADQARMVLHHAGADYESVSVAGKWDDMKEDSPFGHVPFMETDQGVKIGESTAICRYLGNKFGLVGKTPEQNATVDSMVDASKDVLTTNIRPVFMEKDEAKLKEMLLEKRSNIPTMLKFVDRNLGSTSGGPFILGEQVTWGDFALFNLWLVISAILQSDFSSVKNVKAHFDAMKALPTMKDFMEKTKDVPVFPPDMKFPKLD